MPLPLPPTLTLAAVSAGQAHALALDSHGRVWAWGSDAEGQVGLPCGGAGCPGPAAAAAAAPSSAAAWAPACVLGPGSLRGGPACASIAAGGRHSLALAAPAGVPAARRPARPPPPHPPHPPVFAWGWAARGQCGPGVAGPCLRAPTVVGGLAGLPAPVTAIDAGLAHSLFLAGGGAYQCGAGWAAPGGSGREGAPASAPAAQPPADTATPTLVTGGRLDDAGPGGDVAALAAGARHSAALTAAGVVVGWGCARQGGLGPAGRAAVAGADEGADGGVGPLTLVGRGAVGLRAGWWHTLVEVEEEGGGA